MDSRTLFLLIKAMTRSGQHHCPGPGLSPGECGCCPTSGLVEMLAPDQVQGSWSWPRTPITGRFTILPCHPVIHWDTLLCPPSQQWFSKREACINTDLIFWECVRDTKHKSPTDSPPRATESKAGGGGPPCNLYFSTPFRRADLAWRQSCHAWAPLVNSTPNPSPAPCAHHHVSRHKDLG